MSKKTIKVPNIGEFKDVEVIEVLIKDGQEIQKNDPLITIESDKSSVEIPSTESGIVSSLKVKIGDKVSEGSDILELEIKEKEIEKKPSNSQPKIINEEKKVEVKKKSNPQNLIVKDFSGKTAASPKVRKFARELGVCLTSTFFS